VEAYKQSSRRDDDIAVVNAGMRVVFDNTDQPDNVINRIALCYGGMASTTVIASHTAKQLIGRSASDASFANNIEQVANLNEFISHTCGYENSRIAE